MAFEIKTQNEQVNRNSPKATVIGYCGWDERMIVSNALLGGWQNFFGFMIYYPPSVYATIPGLIATDISIRPLGNYNSSTLSFESAELTITYERPEFEEPQSGDTGEENGQEYGEISIDITGEFLALPPANFEWLAETTASTEEDDFEGDFEEFDYEGEIEPFDDPADCARSLAESAVHPQLIVPMVTINLSKKRPDYDLGAIVEALGKVNHQPITIKGYTFPVECLLFDGVNTSRRFSTDGFPLWEMSYSFIGKKESWNRFYRVCTSRFETIAPRVYEQHDLTQLFTN